MFQERPMKARTALASRFEILARIRRGGEGQVYRGRDRETGQQVAIKILHQETLKPRRFQREAALLTELEHPGIVRYVAHGTEGQQHYLVMEWVEGQTLWQILQRGLTLRESVAVTRQIADALSAVHARGMVHRDIKPSNIMFVGGLLEQVKLLDFGIARVVGQQSLTRTGAVVGTPGYMAPEQVRGQWDVDARADVFALGCVLYACLCGHPPFAGQHKLAALASILFLEPIPVALRCPEAPAALVELVGRMLDKNPAARPASAALVAGELDALGALPETPRRPHAAQGAVAPESSDIDPALLDARTETTQTIETATGPHSGEPPVFVLAAFALDTDEDAQRSESESEILERIAQAGALAAHHEGAWSYLVDGLFVAVFASGSDRAERAARCSLALRREIPELPIVVGSGSITPSGPGLDRLVQTLVDESMRRVALATRGAPALTGVRLDESLAEALTGAFEVQRRGLAEYLMASRA
jgi:serine/threonine protein kinase